MSHSEQDIAAVVVAWLESLGADVYQEVTVSGGVADIVTRVHHEIWIVEVKTSLSLALVTQALDRRRLCHRVYIAAPHSRNSRDVGTLCEEIGIGLLSVWPREIGWPDAEHGYGAPKVDIIANSRRWNSRPVALASKLSPEHKTHAKAGAAGAAGRWTPWRNTIEQLARTVRREPGISLKAAIGDITHHYASNAGARSSLAKWCREGAVAGVRYEEGKLYPVEVRS